MRVAFIGCEVLFREFCIAAAHSPLVIDPVILPQGLHNTPADLRARLQLEIDRLDSGPDYASSENNEAIPRQKYDALLLGYALCSNGVVGVTARHIPLIIPRGHDCITLLIGSRAAYQQYFDTHRGVYWYTSGWIERTLQPGVERYQYTLNQYIEKYGEDNAEYLMEMEQAWFKEYQWATYIDWKLPSAESDKKYTRECAEYLGWNYDVVPGDPQLMIDFLAGKWDDERFLTVPAGSCIEPSHADTIVNACAGCSCHGMEQVDDSQPTVMANRT